MSSENADFVNVLECLFSFGKMFCNKEIESIKDNRKKMVSQYHHNSNARKRIYSGIMYRRISRK
jgi:hypothetical protein